MGATKMNVFRENLLLILTVGSVFIGAIVGFTVRPSHPSAQTIDLIGFPGEILMNMLKMMILPLIAASLISGLSQMDLRTSGRIGAYAFMFYVTTMTLAVATGIILVLIIHPGDPSIKRNFAQPVVSNVPANISAVEKLTDLIRNMFPDNLVQASFQQVETSYKQVQVQNTMHDNNVTVENVLKLQRNYVYGINVLGLIVFFIFMGVVMGHLGEKAKPLIDLFTSLDFVITTIVGIIMWYSPIGIASLIAAKILEIGDIAKTARTLSLYMMTVIIGLAIQLFVTLPILYFLASRKNPFSFMKGLVQAAMTAFGTASSAVSLPVTFKCLEENNGVDPKISKFVLPVGAIVNMDGTALYEAVASVFIAQINDIEMGIGTVLTISITATLASIGAASIPSAGLVTMLIVLTAVGLPANDITMIIAIDWFLDRLRTMVNVMGDGFGCGFVQAMVGRSEYLSGLTDGPILATSKVAPQNGKNSFIKNENHYADELHELKVSPRSDIDEVHAAVNGGADFIHPSSAEYCRAQDGSISINVNSHH